MELYNCVCNAMNEDGISKVKTLLEENKDKPKLRKSICHAKDEHGSTLLHYAAKKGYSGLAELLLVETTFGINSMDEDNNTPLHLAAMKGHIDITKVLLKFNADISLRNKNWQTPYEVAEHCGKHDLANIIKTEENSIC